MIALDNAREHQTFFRRFATPIWIAYWIGLTGLLHSPKLPPPPIQISKRGLVAHFTTFAILAGLCAYARLSRDDFSRRGLFFWTSILLTFGVASETLQPLTNRTSDLADFLANASGILVVMAVVLRKRTSPQTIHQKPHERFDTP